MNGDRDKLIADIAEAVRVSIPTLSEDERMWVRLAIQREAQSIALRKAVIEKTLTSLIWAAIVGLGMVLLSWARTNGFKG